MSIDLIRHRFSFSIGWLFLIYGVLGVSFSLPVLYLLLSGMVLPGEPYYLDELAPTESESLIEVSIYMSVLVTGLFLRRYAKRGDAHNKALKSRTPEGAA